MLELYQDYAQGTLGIADFMAAVRLVEAYVFRRRVCGLPSNSLNKTFAAIGKTLSKDRYLQSIEAHFMALPSYRHFPADEEFRRGLQTRDLYNFQGCNYWLGRLENYDRRERVAVDEFTVEHILPQNANLPAAWRQALGSDWKRVQEQWLHTLGNLTLTAYNSKYSDRSFAEKRDMPNGFRESPLKLNAGLGQLDVWNEATIQERAGWLADRALAAWAAPKLDAATLAECRPAQAATRSGYTIEDHPHLRAPGLREVFEAFRRQVLALDPCVTEEFMKLYVAYKAETHFVDVVPQVKRLRLSLNLPFTEINDPRGMCKDVSGIGHLGNGDVEVGLKSLDELPYVMGLVRQSYERQMGEGALG